MKKRLLSLLLVFSMILTLLPATALAAPESGAPSANTNPFTDVKEGDWYYDAVQYARINGFFNGTSNTTFSPDGTMTRGMFVTVLGRMAGVDAEAYKGQSVFSDVPANMYYAPYVAWASTHGITTGTGDGKFSPDALINRQQMATFFVRYFETFSVNYETGANITTTPADIDSVAPYAKDAVLKLWKQGLLNGDGTNFNPNSNASRAQAATLCMRTDEAVETWYKEPGVVSDRVIIGPAATQPAQPQPQPQPQPKPQPPTVPIPPSYEDYTTYYKVTLHCGDTTEDKYYPEGTLLNSIVPPVMDNDKVFLGWFHDDTLTEAVGADEVLLGDINLYAKTGAVSALEESGTPDFIAKMDVTETSDSRFTVGVKWNDGTTSGVIPGIMKDGEVYPSDADVLFRNITNPLLTDGYYNAATDLVPDESVTITNGQIKGNALFTPGNTYQIELLDENLIFDEFMDNGEPADEYVRYFNFSIKKAEVMNLDLNPDMLYIRAEELNETDRQNAMEYVGLYKAVVDTETGETTYAPNNGNGSFSYAGEFKDDIDVGNTVAIYQGNVRPDQRGLNDTGEVVYLTITGISGTTYKYDVANHEDVLFTPDILPIDIDDGDGMVSNADGTLVINSGKLDFSSGYTEIGLDAATTVDVGDFLFFYTGEYGTGGAAGYGLITAVSIGAETATISYTSVTETAVLRAMEMFVEEEPSEEQINAAVDEQAIRESITTQIMESGFVAETGAYLTEMALMTDEVQSVLGEGIGLEDVTISLSDGKTISGDELELMDGNLLHKGENVKLDIAITTNLTHFEDASGVRVEVTVNYEFDIQKKGSDKKINVSLTAFFEQEVKLGISVSGEAIWKKAWIIPYIADYQLSANMDLGSYTGVGITAVAKTDEDKSDSGMPWPQTAAEKKGTAKVFELTKAIKEQMEETKGIFNEGENSASGELADKYSDMLEEADDSWIDLFVVNIYEDYQSVAPAYILAYAVKIDFVVSANLYVALGVTFQYEVSKRYSFAIQLEASNAASDVVETGTNGFRFDAYVMGTMGLRAGIRVKVLAGLFTCKLDGIGIQAEAGAYIQLWGYFYFSYSNYKDMTADPPVWENKKEFTGALLIEIGAYLDVNFVAEVLDGKYAWTPSLYSTTWPLLQIGESENVNDFAYEENDSTLLVEVLEKNTVTLPTSLFDMKYMDLTSGDVYGEKDDNGEWKTNKQGDVLAAKNFDGNTVGADGVDDETRFYITMGNERFTYDPTTNTVTINTVGAVEATCEMTITWAGNPLAFTNNVPSRTVTIDWSNPEGMRYIQFNSTGGSSVKMARGPERGDITWPANPTKTGYTFVDWYTDAACTQVYNGSKTQLPENFGTNEDGTIIKGITLYAKWAPASNRITVEHYQQSLNNRYELFESETVSKIGNEAILTDDPVSFASLSKSYTGFAYNGAKATASHATVQADGSTLVKLYYTRNKYTVTFNVNYPEGTGINVVNSIYFNADMAAAKALCPGYVFDGWYTAASGGDKYDFGTMPAENVTVYAHWKPATDTVYTVTHYKQAASGGWILADTEEMTGTTGAQTMAVAKTYEGFTAGAITQQTIKADGSTVVIVKYSRNTYTLTKNYNDSETDPTVETEQVMFEATMKPAAPTREGHEFSHWVYADAEGNATETVFSPTDTMPGHDVTLIAKWDVQGYNLSYDLAGGTLDESTTVEDTVHDYAVTVTAKSAPVRTGYTFNGWLEQISETETKTYSAGEDFSMPARNVKLVAQWTANTYTVVYDANGGEGTMPDSSCTYDLEHKLTANTFTREGYSFVGWATEKDGEVVCGDGASVKNLTAKSDGMVTLYAVWGIGQYTISFKTDHGTTPAVISADYAAAITLPTLSCPGWTFHGWTLDGVEYTTSTMPARNLELVALWTANDGIEYKVEVYRQDLTGKYPTDPEIHVYANAMDTVVYAASGDFLVEGFAYDSANSDKVESGRVSVDGEGNGTLVLKLYYTRNKPTISFDTGLGSKVDAIEAYYGTAITLPQSSRPGYYFNGWILEGVPYATSTMPAESITLFADWAAEDGVSYFVEVYYQNERGEYSDTAETLWEGSGKTGDEVKGLEGQFLKTNFTYDSEKSAPTASGIITVDGSGTGNLVLKLYYTRNQYTITFDTDGGSTIDPVTTYFDGEVTAPADPAKAGYTFAGWDPEIPDAMPAEDVTITAKWTINQYTITFNTDGGTEVAPITQNYVTAVYAPLNPTKEGYTFAGWDPEIPDAMPAENMTITAKWTVNRYTITFVDDGEKITSEQFDYGSAVSMEKPADLTKEGYTFAGWDKDIPETMPAENVTITAKWTIDQYTITFDSNGGSEVSAITQDYGTAITAPAAPTKEGYTFVGWDPELPATMPAENMTITAQWRINQYTISFSTGGTAIDSITQDYGTAVTAPADPSRTGYIFTGWDPEIPATMPAEDVTITAQWTPVSYGITYDLAGGTVSELTPNLTAYTIESEEITLTNPTRTGYTFAGWTGTDLDGATKNVTIPTGSTGDRSYTATWTAEEYSITLNSNNGTLVGSNTISYSIESDDITLEQPTRIGYTFAGWTGTGLNNASVSVTIPTGSTGDREYTATWAAIEHPMKYVHSVGNIANGVTGLQPKWTVETAGVTVNGDGTVTLTLPTPSYNTPQYTFAGYSGTGITRDGNVYQLTVSASDSSENEVTVNWTENETKLTVYSGTTGDGTFFESTTAGATYNLSNTVTVGETTYYIPGWIDDVGTIIYTSTPVTVEAFIAKTYRPLAVTEIPTANDINTTYTYNIYTGDQLKLLAEKLTVNCTYVFNLMSDITLTDWTTGFVFSEFADVNVTFNGNGKIITFGEGCTAPLFALLTNDVSFSDLTTEGTINCGDNYASALVGKIKSLYSTDAATFENCINKAAIYGKVVGGLVGYIYYNKIEISFTDCTNSGNLTGTGSTGGLLGYNAVSGTSMQFTNCTNTGDITAAGSYVGGLVGNALGTVTVENCTVSGTLTGNGPSDGNGFIGYCSYGGFTKIGTNTDTTKRVG